MRYITHFEATQYSIEELHGLLRDLFNKLAKLSVDDPDYQVTKASMENVETEIRSRSHLP